MPTKTRYSGIDQEQLTALNLLATGSRVTAAAEAVGVTRQTTSEWLTKTSSFRLRSTGAS